MKCKICNEEMRLLNYDDSQPHVEYYYYKCSCGMCFGTTIQNGEVLGNEWFNAIKKLKETEEIKKKIDDFYLEKEVKEWQENMSVKANVVENSL